MFWVGVTYIGVFEMAHGSKILTWEGYMIYGNDMNMRVAISWGFLIKMCAWSNFPSNIWCLEYQDSKKISYITYLYNFWVGVILKPYLLTFLFSI